MFIKLENFGSYSSDEGMDPIVCAVNKVLTGEIDVAFAQSKSITSIFDAARQLIQELNTQRSGTYAQEIVRKSYAPSLLVTDHPVFIRDQDIRCDENIRRLSSSARNKAESILDFFSEAAGDFHTLNVAFFKEHKLAQEIMHRHDNALLDGKISAELLLCASTNPSLTTRIKLGKKKILRAPRDTIVVLRNGGGKFNPWHGSPENNGSGNHDRLVCDFNVMIR